MKPYALIMFCIFLISCSKKSHILNTKQTSQTLQTATDSSGYNNLLSSDKSITTTTVDLDTFIKINGRFLSGNFDWLDSTKHYENDDLSVDFEKDKLNSRIFFKILSKPKTINARYHRKTTTQNDIVKIQDSKLRVTRETKTERDSLSNHVIDTQDPTAATNNVKSLIIWIIILLVIAITVFIYFKKNITS